jgi:peptidoglycan/xylan/chitin deacetylase (PgdA/CDA1 family)
VSSWQRDPDSDGLASPLRQCVCRGKELDEETIGQECEAVSKTGFAGEARLCSAKVIIRQSQNARRGLAASRSCAIISFVRDVSTDRGASRWRAQLRGLLATQNIARSGHDSVLLTFDDGPHPEGTPRILEALHRYQARAVFFVVGSRIKRAPHLLRRILDEGHLLGNHSHDHVSSRSLGLRLYLDDVRRCQEAIHSLTGIRPVLFRPPLGELSPCTIAAPRLLGLQCVLWSIDTDDWRIRDGNDLSVCAQRLRRRLSGRDLHEIVLMHDEQPWSGMLLDHVLPALVERGVDLRQGVDTLIRA